MQVAVKQDSRFFSLRVICLLVLLLCLSVAWLAPKDDSSDAWAYHVYAGLMLLDDRMESDYFGASTQGYFNPLVHLPFAAMVKAEWQDRIIACVMAFYSSLALMLLAVFYRYSLHLRRWELVAALLMSLSGLVVWTGVGSSVPDLFLQIPVFISLLFLFDRKELLSGYLLTAAGFFLGVALGLKLSAIIYIPAYLAVLLLRLCKKQVTFSHLIGFGVACLAGFLLVYAWWGMQLYRSFGNPFFPFFNEWFKSPDFSQGPLVNHRFLRVSRIVQFFLPFMAAFSDPFTYIEMRQPDIRPGCYVLSVVALIVSVLRKQGKTVIGRRHGEFIFFLTVLLYVWVFISGNGRYAIGLFCLMGVGIVICLRSVFGQKIYRSVFLLILFLQWTVLYQAFQLSESPFRFRDTKWGGTWFNVDFGGVLGEGGYLLLTGTENSYSAFVKDVGPDTSVINVYGLYALDLNETIKDKIKKHDGKILGMVVAGPDLHKHREALENVYFKEFGRFGLRVADSEYCRFVERVEGDGTVKGGFLFCPLYSDPMAIHEYDILISGAREYFLEIESACPDVFSPVGQAITLEGNAARKYYANYEIEVYYDFSGRVMAKKDWSMKGFDLGNLDELRAAPSAWAKRHCPELQKVRAMGVCSVC